MTIASDVANGLDSYTRERAQIGAHTHVSWGVGIGKDAVIGSLCVIEPNAMVETGTHVEDGARVTTGTTVAAGRTVPAGTRFGRKDGEAGPGN